MRNPAVYFSVFFLQLNNFLLKDDINPIKGVYIVLFVFYRTRDPPECSPSLTKKERFLGEVA